MNATFTDDDMKVAKQADKEIKSMDDLIPMFVADLEEKQKKTAAIESELESLFAGSAEMSQEQVVKLARVYLDARRRHEESEMALRKLAEQRQKAESDLVLAMESAGVKGLKVDHDGSTVGISQTKSVYYSLPSGALDDAGIVEWIKTVGGADLIKSTIHHSSFSSFCREIVSQEQALHPSVKVAEKRGVQVRSG